MYQFDRNPHKHYIFLNPLLKNRKYFDANNCYFVSCTGAPAFFEKGFKGKNFFFVPPRRSTFDFLATGSKKYNTPNE